MKPIAHIYTDLPQKFGIPRQSGLAPHLVGRIVFEEEYALPSAVKGLEGFSHLWLIWQFENGAAGGAAQDVENDSLSEAAHGETSVGGHWSPTVRPPRLGGAQRVGVFATRSPFRPNPIGLSCVELDHVELGENGPIIHVRGADLRDGTPILDIKPYLPLADCKPEATSGFVNDAQWETLSVDFPNELLERMPAEKQAGLIEILEQDPNPVGRKRSKDGTEHFLAYAGFRISYAIEGTNLTVLDVQELGE